MKAINLLVAKAELEGIEKIYFNKRILLIGFGAVGQSMLPTILKHFSTNTENITVLEKDDNSLLFTKEYGNSGVNYIVNEIVKDNMESVISEYVGSGDLIINLSCNIDGTELAVWCLTNNVLYIDTSIERWGTIQDEDIPNPEDRTLYADHQKLRLKTKKFKDSATCVVTHGANPGIVSHFTKQALLDMSKALKMKIQIPETREEWASLMQELEVRVIHISERDTQVLKSPKLQNEFVNTWSCEGFWAEGRSPSELGWGTHETELPRHGFAHTTGPKNSIYINKPGVSVLVKSWVPKGGNINGFVVQHSEAITISEYFTVTKGKKAIYRPTVHYAYCPCDAALVSVHEFKDHELQMQAKSRIAKDEIISGIDELGVLLLGDKISWWYGSQLDIKEARSLIKGQNATTVQVIASLLGALSWMIKNPKMGFCEPEDLPFEYVLAIAKKYLGPIESTATDWHPSDNRTQLYRKKVDQDNPWSFSNFRVY